MNEAKCPYCGEILEVQQSSRDHVFVKALGATATVWACGPCNSTLGHEVEGKLLKRDSPLNLTRLVNGIGGVPVRGTLSTGTEVEYDLRSSELKAQKPVEDLGDRWIVSGGPQQVRRLLSQMKRSAEQIEADLAGATDEHLGDQMLSFDMIVDLDLEARLVAKIALGCGYGTAPEWFPGTELAENLRLLCNGEATSSDSIPPNSIETLYRTIQETIARFSPSFYLEPFVVEGRSQMFFLPLEKERTACIAILNSYRIGMVVEGALGVGANLGLVVTDDGEGRLVARKVGEEVHAALKHYQPSSM